MKLFKVLIFGFVLSVIMGLGWYYLCRGMGYSEEDCTFFMLCMME